MNQNLRKPLANSFQALPVSPWRGGTDTDAGAGTGSDAGLRRVVGRSFQLARGVLVGSVAASEGVRYGTASGLTPARRRRIDFQIVCVDAGPPEVRTAPTLASRGRRW